MLKKIFQEIFNLKIIVKIFEVLSQRKSFSKLPLGVDFATDLEYYMPKYNIKTIFDVGANVGQSANKYSTDFKSVNIFCFEPVKSTFNILVENTKAKKNIKCFNIAFGNKNSTEKILISNKGNVFNKIIKSENIKDDAMSEDITVKRIDDFYREYFNNEISINLMKIDTEGYDFEVLKGSENLITNNKIDFIEVETSMNKSNNDHIIWSKFVDFFNKYDYYIFGIYEQTLDFKLKKPIQRRSNIVFVSPSVYNKF